MRTHSALVRRSLVQERARSRPNGPHFLQFKADTTVSRDTSARPDARLNATKRALLSPRSLLRFSLALCTRALSRPLATGGCGNAPDPPPLSARSQAGARTETHSKMSLLRGAIKVGFGFGFTYVVVWGLVGSLERSYENRCVSVRVCVCARGGRACPGDTPLLHLFSLPARPFFAGTCSAWRPRRRTLRS